MEIKKIIDLAHQVQAGKSGNYASKSDWHSALRALAAEQQKPAESIQQSVSRLVLSDPDAKALYKCWRTASGDDARPAPATVPTRVIKINDSHQKLSEIASGLRVADPTLTRFDALKRAYDNNPILGAAAKSESAA
jgi:hypothetical protein